MVQVQMKRRQERQMKRMGDVTVDEPGIGGRCVEWGCCEWADLQVQMQLCQQFDDPNRPLDLSSMLSQPSSTTLAPHALPLSSHFFSSPPPSSTSSFIYPGDVPPSFQFSVPPIYNNTPISPRGTLQSIFSNPANSSMQPHMPMPPLSMMMGALQQAHVYGAALNSVRDQDRHDNDEKIRQRSAELGSPDLHQHSRIPMRIHGMELDSRVEETRITPSSMQAKFQ